MHRCISERDALLRIQDTESRIKNEELRKIMEMRNKKGFTLVEVVTAIGILVVVVVFTGIIFRSSIESYRIAGANAEIIQNLQAITTQLDRDFGGLCTDGYLKILSEKKNDCKEYASLSKIVDVNMSRIYYFTTGDFQSVEPGTDTKGNIVYERSNIAIVYFGHDYQSLYDIKPCTSVSKYRLARDVSLLTPFPKSATIPPPTDCNKISYSQYNNFLRISDFNTIKDPSKVLRVDLNQQVNIGRYMADGVGDLKIEWTYGQMDINNRLMWILGSQEWKGGEQWPRAIKFTFTLYDSKGILKGGSRFTHIVYLD